MKCFEHTAECFVGSHFTRFILTKLTHFFRLLIASGQESPKKGMECTKISFEGSAALLQFAAAHLSGMSKKKGIRLAITGLSASHQRKEMASSADITYLTGAQFPVDLAVN